MHSYVSIEFLIFVARLIHFALVVGSNLHSISLYDRISKVEMMRDPSWLELFQFERRLARMEERQSELEEQVEEVEGAIGGLGRRLVRASKSQGERT